MKSSKLVTVFSLLASMLVYNVTSKNVLFERKVQDMLHDKILKAGHTLAERLITADDTQFEKQTKSLLAQYIVSAAAESAVRETQASEETSATTKFPVILGSTTPSNGSPSPAQVAASSTRAPAAVTSAPLTTPIPSFTLIRPTVTPEHVLDQVSKVLDNVSRLNVTGIVDESLGIHTPTPVRGFVNGIMQLVFCDPISRLFNRCRNRGRDGIQL